MRLLVLPESALGGYLREPGPEASAPDIPAGLDPDGPEIARLIELAGDVVVCAGYTEAGDGVLYASAVCVNGDGVLGHQRKVHLPPAERFAYTAGDGFAAFDTPVGRVGMLLCYDKLFPEAARALALDGADVHLLAVGLGRRPHAPRRPTSATTSRPATSTSATRRARSRTRSSWCRRTRPARGGRCTSSARPRSSTRAARVLATTGADEGLAVAEVDLAAVHEIRLGIDHLADRRPDAYAPPLPAATALGFAH